MYLAQDKNQWRAPVTIGLHNTQSSLTPLGPTSLSKTILPQDIKKLQVLWRRVCDVYYSETLRSAAKTSWRQDYILHCPLADDWAGLINS